MALEVAEAADKGEEGVDRSMTTKMEETDSRKINTAVDDVEDEVETEGRLAEKVNKMR